MKSWDQWLVVIPARLASTRLPRKPLADLLGKPLIVRVYERVAPLAARGAAVRVATDSEEVEKVCEAHGVPVVMTRADHQSGTDRAAEVARGIDRPLVMNVQGDEPFVSLEDLERLATAMTSDPRAQMGTLAHQRTDALAFANPNVVKAVRSQSGHALYFSRAPVPHTRGAIAKASEFWHHIGIYAFTRDTLAQFCRLPPSPLEQRESLEQLRALENGISILLVPAEAPSLGIDTPEDLEEARALLSQTASDCPHPRS